MLLNTRNTAASWIAMVLLALTVSGCSTPATPRYDGKQAPDPSKAVLIGSISEGFLTQPHGLGVGVLKKTEPQARVSLDTLNMEDDFTPPNVLGNFFMYEVPAGEYEVTGWGYLHYAGFPTQRTTPIRFTVKPGEIAYIGDFNANSLTFCLSNVDHGDASISKLKAKYPVLNDRQITNLTPQSAFGPWPNSDAKDIGHGLCKLVE